MSLIKVTTKKNFYYSLTFLFYLFFSSPFLFSQEQVNDTNPDTNNVKTLPLHPWVEEKVDNFIKDIESFLEYGNALPSAEQKAIYAAEQLIQLGDQAAKAIPTFLKFLPNIKRSDIRYDILRNIGTMGQGRLSLEQKKETANRLISIIEKDQNMDKAAAKSLIDLDLFLPMEIPPLLQILRHTLDTDMDDAAFINNICDHISNIKHINKKFIDGKYFIDLITHKINISWNISSRQKFFKALLTNIEPPLTEFRTSIFNQLINQLKSYNQLTSRREDEIKPVIEFLSDFVESEPDIMTAFIETVDHGPILVAMKTLILKSLLSIKERNKSILELELKLLKESPPKKIQNENIIELVLLDLENLEKSEALPKELEPVLKNILANDAYSFDNKKLAIKLLSKLRHITVDELFLVLTKNKILSKYEFQFFINQLDPNENDDLISRLIEKIKNNPSHWLRSGYSSYESYLTNLI
ncbi:MAG: hypothetical protein HY843_09275, partial [Bdellovibrio sp.]|nr:hypothetical protein [Bdellovibrio sp.]